MSIAFAEDAVYTASRDKLVKRWKPRKLANGRFELVVDLEVPLGDTCWSMALVGEWIFCGLADGSIKAFSKSGGNTVLRGHNKRVSCFLVHQHVLVSGGSDATVRCWVADQASGSFNCTHAINEGIPGTTVSCLCVLGDHMWVGGSSGIAVVELTSLRVVHQIAPKKFVSAFLTFGGHIIAAYADGSLRIFDGTGNEKLSQQSLDSGPILCVAGLESGPRLLCGHARGQMSSISLPDFRHVKSWQVLERTKVQSICCAAEEGIFVVGGENGTLQLWRRDDVPDL